MPVTVEYRNVLASEPGGKRRFSAVKHSRESVPVRIVVTAITIRTYVHSTLSHSRVSWSLILISMGFPRNSRSH